MSGREGIEAAWDEAARGRSRQGHIHPSGFLSEAAYRASGVLNAGKLLPLLEGYDVVVDFGAGDGRVAIPLALAGVNVIAVDSSPAMLDELTLRAPEIATVVNDGADLLEALGGPVDAIYVLAVLIHHDHADGAAIISELARAIRPGGRLLLDLPLYDEARDRRSWVDVTVWTSAELEDLARALDLVVVEAPRSTGTFNFSALGAHHGDLVILERRA